MAAGCDGNLWFIELSDRVGRITTSGAVTEFANGITPSSRPAGIAAGPDGNLWFTEFRADQVARIGPGACLAPPAPPPPPPEPVVIAPRFTG
jgi:streptogramin lyase